MAYDATKPDSVQSLVQATASIRDNFAAIVGGTSGMTPVMGKSKNLPEGTNLNTIWDTGFYDGYNLTNGPVANTWFYYQVQRHSFDVGGYWIRQEAFNFGGYSSWVRYASNNVWGAWVRNPSPAAVSVMEFGAATVSMHTVIADMLAAGIRNIYIPAGTYNTTATIAINQAGVTLFGDGMSRSIITTTSGTAPGNFIAVTKADNVIRDLQILGNRTTLAAGVDIYQCGIDYSTTNAVRCLLERVELASINCHAIRIYVDPAYITIKDCFIHDNGQYNTIGGGDAKLGRGITVQPSGTTFPQNIRIEGNRFERNYSTYWSGLGGDPYGAAVFCEGRYVSILNNLILNNYNSGGQLVLGHNGGTAEQNYIVTGNRILGSGSEPTGSNMSGIEMGGSTALIEGNEFDHLRGCGVIVQAMATFDIENVRIIGNNINDVNISATSTWAGVAFSDGTSSTAVIKDCVVSGNTFSNMDRGIIVSGTKVNAGTVKIAEDNVFASTVTTRIADANKKLRILHGSGHVIQSVTLANGANNDIALNPDTTILRITGPTAVFSISGFAGGLEGRQIIVINDVAQNMTISHLTGSAAGNQIYVTAQGDANITGNLRQANFFVYVGANTTTALGANGGWMMVGGLGGQ